MSNVLEVQHLTKSYGTFVLDDISFSVRENTIMGFIGRNGAGKTTTLKSLLNQIHPDSGDVKFFGMDFKTQEIEIKKNIGFVSGGVSFYPRKTLQAITNVTKRFFSSWDDQAYQKYLNLFQLDENKKPSELSEGMKVKYMLALALSHHARFLILDEPTSGLDPVSRDELLEVFLDLVEKEHITILFSTHITSDLDKCADDITYIKNGKMMASTTVREFTEDYCQVKGKESAIPSGMKSKLIGYRQHSGEFTAVIYRHDVEEAWKNKEQISIADASLEDIMIHFER